MKKKLLILIIAFLPFFLTGCWSYVGMDEITIVTGIAIDKKDETDFLLTFEVIDLSDSSKDSGIVTRLVESTGKTVFDAVRDAKSIVSNKLHFANAQIIVISNSVAKDDGILDMINFFIRDAEIRETIMVAISKEESAASLLNTEGVTQNIISFKIKDIISDSEKVNLYTTGIPLYNVINILGGNGTELVLPAFKKSLIDDNEVVMLNGLATFKDDKLYEFMGPDDVKFYLFTIDMVDGGILTFKTDEEKEEDNISIEIAKSKTNVKYENKDGKLKFTLKVKTTGIIGAFNEQGDLLNNERVKEIEKLTSDKLKEKIEKVINKIQENNNYDILRLGNKIYTKEPKLWKKLKEDWNKNFPKLDINVECEVIIKNTAFFR